MALSRVGSGKSGNSPAVANALINTVDGLASACQKGRGKNWRGDVISTIANNMPKPESIKDDLSVYPTDADWDSNSEPRPESSQEILVGKGDSPQSGPPFMVRVLYPA